MKIEKFTYSYPNNNGFSISIQQNEIIKGEIVFLHGKSGCGKTTILNLLSGVIESDLMNQVNQHFSNVDYLMHESKLLPWKNIRDIFFIEGKLRKINAELEVFTFFLEQFNLPDVLIKKPKELSLGMRQRVELAKALSFKPDLLLLDESFSGIDDKTKEIVFDLLLKYVSTSNCSVIATAHQILDQLSIADKIIWINRGEMAETLTFDISKEQRLIAKKEELLELEIVKHLIQ